MLYLDEGFQHTFPAQPPLLKMLISSGTHMAGISGSETSAAQLLEVVCGAALAAARLEGSLSSLQLAIRCIPLPQQLIDRLHP